jgi:hypothetical protein
MARNTHYHVLPHGSAGPTFRKPISPGGNKIEVNWNPSNDIVLDSDSLSPVLSYRADPSNDAKNLKFKVIMENQLHTKRTVSSITLGGTVSRTIFDVLPRSVITKDNMRNLTSRRNPECPARFLSTKPSEGWMRSR